MIPDLPGWGSLPAVTRFHNWAELAGIAFLGLLVITELVAYRYGQRKDELTAQEQTATDHRHDEEMARLHMETAQMQARAAGAELELAKIKLPRTLGPARQQAIAVATRPFADQRYRVAISGAADDGIDFWGSLYATLESAGWVYVPPTGPPTVGNPPAGIPIAAAPGVEIVFDPASEAELTAPALALGNALHADGTAVAVNRDVQSNPNEADRDILLIRIGARVPPP
jgi:hypothetical protein